MVALLFGGCAKHVQSPVDPTLPEPIEELAVLAPIDVLAAIDDNEDPSLRARALGLLVLLSNEPAGGRWGPRTLYDGDPWVERAGVEALGARVPEPEAIALLEAYLARDTTDPYVRCRAAILLAGAGSTAAADALGDAWRHEPQVWKRAPLALAGLALGDESALQPLAAALSAGDIALEIPFVLDVGHTGRPELQSALREGAARVEEELTLPYAVARIALGDPSGEQVLRKALNHVDDTIRLEALDYLSKMEHPPATALLRRARGQGSDLVRWYADMALAARTGEGLELLERAMAGSPEVRALAVRFAAEATHGPVDQSGRRTARIVRKVLRDALADEDPTVRTEALRSAAAIRLQGADELLHANLRDDFLPVRIEAAGALLALGPRKG